MVADCHVSPRVLGGILAMTFLVSLFHPSARKNIKRFDKSNPYNK
jgi:hypothetical protein